MIAPQQLPDRDNVVRLRVPPLVYKTLVDNSADERRTQMSYDGETLELMSPGTEHELLANLISDLITLASAEWSIDLTNFGSATLRTPQFGFEADKTYYLDALHRIANLEKIDLTVDPAPDLLIEVDITSNCLTRLAAYASIGVGEVWRYSTDRLAALALVETTYVEIGISRIIRGLPIAEIADRIERFNTGRSSMAVLRTDWQRWLRENRSLHDAR